MLKVRGIRQHQEPYLLCDLCQSGQVKHRFSCCGFSLFLITKIHLFSLPIAESAEHMERKGIYTMWSRDNGGIIKENSIISISEYFSAIFIFL